MNALMIIPPNAPKGGKRRLILKHIVAILCAVVLIFGVSYAGTWVAHRGINTLSNSTEEAQVNLLPR